jgi:hypothetical protein
MPKRFNYTGRKKILTEHRSIQIRREDNSYYFDADLQLDSYHFDPNALIHVEAYRGSSALWKRIPFGRIAARKTPAVAERSLREFGDCKGIHFRVKVTADDTTNARILGQADQITPIHPEESEASRQSLLGTRTEKLNGELWRIDFDGARPELVLDEQLPGGTSYALDKTFQALVTPQVFRLILNEILVDNYGEGDEDDPLHWHNQWIKFAEKLPGMPACPDQQEPGDRKQQYSSWIEDAVSAFARHARFLDVFLSLQEREGRS